MIARFGTLSQNTLILLAGNLGGTVLAFLLSVLIGRGTGESGLGVYTAVLAWIFALSMLVDRGIGSLFTRDLAQDEGRTPAYVQAAVNQHMLAGCTLIALIWIGAPLLSQTPAVIDGLRLSAPMVLIEPLFGLYTAIFRARQAMLPIALLNISMLIPQVIFTALVLIGGGDIQAALLINVLTSLGRLIAGWWIYRLRFRGKRGLATISGMTLLKLALPFAVAGILTVIQGRVGILLLEKLGPIEGVGQYGAANRFVEAARMIPNALFGALFPALAALSMKPDAFRHVFRRVMLGLTAFGIIAGIVGTLFALPVMLFTYGDAFINAVPVLQILVWALLPGILRAARVLYWYAKGREGLVNCVILIMLITQVIIGVWLIPVQGATGLALSLIVSETIGLILLR